jgi:hypothetical protein
MPQESFDIYVSYAPEDFEQVRKIAEELEWAGLRVWYRDQPQSSADSVALISSAIDATRAHLVVWSKDSAASGRIQAEARASSEKGRLIASRIDPVLPPKGTKAVVYADLIDWQGGQDHRGFRKILTAIHQLTGKGPEPAPGEEGAQIDGNADMLNDAEKDERAWQITMSYNNKTYFEYYLKHFPNGKHVGEARELLEKKKRTGRIIITCAVIFFAVQLIFSLIVNLARF